jgi:hypothetical protein
MSNQRFIKYIPSEKATWLRKKYPNAFLLLSLIAERARRVPNSPDGFEIGDALVGDYEEAGLTRKEYRTALEKLQEFGYIEILLKSKNSKKVQKRAIKGAIKGTLVNLLNSDIWEINAEVYGHQIGQERAIKGPSKPPISKETHTYSKKNKEHCPIAAELLSEFYISLSSKFPQIPSEQMKKTTAELNAMEALVKSYGSFKVREVFIYAHEDDFWRAHVHTASYLKNKFTKLMIQMESKDKAAIGKRSTDRMTKDIHGNPVENLYAGIF